MSVSSAASEANEANEANEVLNASPIKTVGWSHFPIPFVYAEWEAAAVKNFGRLSIAKYNNHLYEDLSPAKAEDQPVPKNPALDALIKKDLPHARDVMEIALKDKSSRPKWSVIAATDEVKSKSFIPALNEIALHSEQATDRAFAFRGLAKLGAKDSDIENGLFDDNYSVQMLCMELLAERNSLMGCAFVIMPFQELNTFHYLFFQNSVQKLLPTVKAPKFYSLKVDERRILIEKSHPGIVQKLIDRAAQNKERPAAAAILYLLGEPKQREVALAVLSKTLLEQGNYPDEFHSPRFWLRGMITQTLQNGTPAQDMLLQKTLSDELAICAKEGQVPKSREMLLLTLCYSFRFKSFPEAAKALAKVRTLKTDNNDVYLAAALSLARAGSPEAFPSLLHVFGLKQEPFCTQACNALESLTGVATPGRAESEGVLEHMGLPEPKLDVAQSYSFWNQWYEKNKGKLRYDKTKQIFLIGK